MSKRAKFHPETNIKDFPVRFKCAKRLAKIAKEMAEIVYRLQGERNDQAVSAMRGESMNRIPSYESRISLYENKLNDLRDRLISDAEFMIDTGLLDFGDQNMAFEGAITGIAWKLDKMGDVYYLSSNEWHVYYPYSAAYYRMFRNLTEAAYNAIREAVLSVDERKDLHEARIAKYKAYYEQQKARERRVNQLNGDRFNPRGFTEDNLIALADNYRQAGHKIPKPHAGKYGLTYKGKNLLIQGIMKVEFPTRMYEPEGYQDWLKKQKEEE